MITGLMLKQARKAKGLTQKEMAELLRVSRQTVVALERNPKKVTEAECILYAYGFKIT